jgi:hypothetical protein
MKNIINIFFTLTLLLLLIQIIPDCHAQGSNGVFAVSGTCNACENVGTSLDDDFVSNMIDGMCQKMGLNNRFDIRSCNDVPSCRACLSQGRPLILYNNRYLRHLKGYDFIDVTLPEISGEEDWQSLTVLAHELGHHFNNHLTNSKPGSTDFGKELEADHFAGHMIHLLGGTLLQAQKVYQTLSVEGTTTHPSRAERLKAVEAGWREVAGEVRGNTNVFAEKLLTKLTPHDDSLILDAANECLIKLTEGIENLTTQEKGIPKNMQRQRKDQIEKDLIDMFSSPRYEKCIQLKINNSIFWRSRL